MPYPSLTFAQMLENATRQELEQFVSLLQGYLSVEHKEDGTHSAITGDSISVTGALTGGSYGRFTGDLIALFGTGSETGLGTLSTVNGTSLLPAEVSRQGVLIGGVASGLFLEARVGTAQSPFTSNTTELLIWNLKASTTKAAARLGVIGGVPTLLDGGSGASLSLGDATQTTDSPFIYGQTIESLGAFKADTTVTWKRGSNLTLANGKNNNVNPGATSFVGAITGPTAAFSISGIVAGADGQWLSIAHNTGQVLTLDHSDAGSTAANQIFCPGAASVTTSASYGTALLQYDSAIPGWVVLSVK